LLTFEENFIFPICNFIFFFFPFFNKNFPEIFIYIPKQKNIFKIFLKMFLNKLLKELKKKRKKDIDFKNNFFIQFLKITLFLKNSVNIKLFIV
jgi:hypothetical protein